MIGDSVIQRLAASEVPCQAPLILGGRRSAAGGRGWAPAVLQCRLCRCRCCPTADRLLPGL